MNLASHHGMLLIPYVEDTLPPNNKSLVLVSNILAKTKYYVTTKIIIIVMIYEILIPLFLYSFFENSIARGVDLNPRHLH